MKPEGRRFETVSLQVFRNLFSSLAEEMGITLKLASFSPNIKMRLDFSCAVFDAGGRLLAQAAHIPVHLGSMGLAMEAVLAELCLSPGDVVILNDPFRGGTHLPDITLVSTAYHEDQRLGYLMSRAHHSDVGGITPASMPLATDIFQEGVIIPPVKLADAGAVDEEVMKLILRNVRTPEERRGDLAAQLSAQNAGERRFVELADRYGPDELQTQSSELMHYAELMTRSLIRRLPEDGLEAEDFLDDDGFGAEPIPIRVAIRKECDCLKVDFSESADQQPGPINAVRAVTQSAVLYVIRTLIAEDVPVNAGMLRPVDVVTRPGSVVDARPPAPVSAGNVETSQRIVDVLFKALAPALPERVPAASQGTMNNLTFGGYDSIRGRPFAYYETMGGGMGGRPGRPGMSAVHDHMSNTLNTPVEVLESEYPVRVLRYQIRAGSGGSGLHRGGDGLRRDIQLLEPASVSIISERRRLGPYGLFGGEDGEPGRNALIRDGQVHELPGKAAVDVRPGDVVSVQTPGGGGYGNPGSMQSTPSENRP